jgi:hypothetical protein
MVAASGPLCISRDVCDLRRPDGTIDPGSTLPGRAKLVGRAWGNVCPVGDLDLPIGELLDSCRERETGAALISADSVKIET